MIKRSIIIGDIHGNYKALRQVLDRCEYDMFNDRLITMGDYVDRWEDSYSVIQFFIDIQHIVGNQNIHLLGNHDAWLLDIFQNDLLRFEAGDADYIKRKYPHMYNQGGRETFNSYLRKVDPKPDYEAHLKFLSELKWFHIENNIAFVHGGCDFQTFSSIDDAYNIEKEHLIWDRSLWNKACHLHHLLDKGYSVSENKIKFGGYETIFIGHTSTEYVFPKTYPVKCCNIINVDNGCGALTPGYGALTAYILETGEVFTSDFVLPKI